jgi:hypothetical protein
MRRGVRMVNHMRMNMHMHMDVRMRMNMHTPTKMPLKANHQEGRLWILDDSGM